VCGDIISGYGESVHMEELLIDPQTTRSSPKTNAGTLADVFVFGFNGNAVCLPEVEYRARRTKDFICWSVGGADV